MKDRKNGVQKKNSVGGRLDAGKPGRQTGFGFE